MQLVQEQYEQTVAACALPASPRRTCISMLMSSRSNHLSFLALSTGSRKYCCCCCCCCWGCAGCWSS